MNQLCVRLIPENEMEDATKKNDADLPWSTVPTT
jgi:hypothetical protein